MPSAAFLQGYSVVLQPTHRRRARPELAGVHEHASKNLKLLEPVIVVGLIEKEGGNFYNTALAIERGTVVARYRKTYLLRGEQAVFQPGEAFPVFDVPKVGINICYRLELLGVGAARV